MIYIDIPGAEKKEIHHIVFDYNGTIAIDGVAVLQEEGLATAALFAADLVVKDILDVFALLETPDRIMASLRK